MLVYSPQLSYSDTCALQLSHSFSGLTRASKVSNTVPDLPSDLATKVWDDTVFRLSELVHSRTNVEKLGGVLAIGVYRALDWDQS